MQIELAPLQLPDFGLPSVQPRIPAATYEQRLQKLLLRAAAQQFDAVLVYGDREHFANLAYLTGYDPRFEEALLILTHERDGFLERLFGRSAPPDWRPIRPRTPALLVGNEGWGYAEISPIRLERILYQNFSLPGQPRDRSESLESILRAQGITAGSRVGVIGWKYDESRPETYTDWLDIPAYIADTLRAIVGAEGQALNITAMLINPLDGQRIINDVDQLAAFEFAATHTSQAVRNVLFGLRPGMTEFDAVRLMQLNGLPHAVHLMLSSGPRAGLGLPSPSLRVISEGEPFMTAFGLWGGLNARAGFVVRDADGLPAEIRDYVEKLVKPYFRAVVRWYEAVGIGVSGGTLYDLVHDEIGDPFFGVGLNPGHYIHLDEWVHSPVCKGSAVRLQSGMALQMDVIPATGTPYFTTNVEDGIALADAELRAAFERQYPEAWGRIQARRRFMQDALGIRLKPEVLPFSNIPAYLPPYLLSPQMALRVAR